MRLMETCPSVFLLAATVALADHNSCYRDYCYTWNGKVSNYTSRDSCRKPYWGLEISSQSVETEVYWFIKDLKILDNYILLYMTCGSFGCYWNHSKARVNNDGWYFRSNRSETPVIRTNSFNNTWYIPDDTSFKATVICMKPRPASEAYTSSNQKSPAMSAAVTTAHPEITFDLLTTASWNDSSSDIKTEIVVGCVLPIGVVFIFLIFVVVFLRHRKRKLRRRKLQLLPRRTISISRLKEDVDDYEPIGFTAEETVYTQLLLEPSPSPTQAGRPKLPIDRKSMLTPMYGNILSP